MINFINYLPLQTYKNGNQSVDRSPEEIHISKSWDSKIRYEQNQSTGTIDWI